MLGGRLLFLGILTAYVCAAEAGVTIDTVKPGDGVSFPETGKVCCVFTWLEYNSQD